jgi:predicted Zn finger-like uncharacterized protein
MIIECEGCEAQYNISDSKIPEGGTRMKCKKCQTIINVNRESAMPEPDAALAPETKNEVINKAKDTASALSEKAVHFGKKAKEKATYLKETAVAKSAPDQNKLKTLVADSPNSKLNRFLFLSFKIGKYISAFCIVAFFLIFLGSAIFYFVGFGDSFEEPEFESIVPYIEATDANKKPDFSKIDERKEVEDKYGDKIKKVVEYGFSEETYDIFLNRLVNYPAKYREAYIEGLDEFLNDGLNYKRKRQNNNIDIVSLSKAYKQAFDEEISEAKYAASKDSTKKWTVLGVIAVSMFLYILFLVIPILIKIEENTRNSKTVITPEMELAAAQKENANSTIYRQSSTMGNPTSAQA